MKLVKFLIYACTLAFVTSSYAADTYVAASNTVNIPLVKVNSTYYANVQISVGSVVSVGSKDATAPAYDVYNAANNQLTMPEVLVGGTTYYNVVITVGSVISVGGACSTA